MAATMATVTATVAAVTSNAVRTLDAIEDALCDPAGPWSPLFDWAENRYGVKPLKLFAGLACLSAVYMSSDGYGSLLFADLVCFAYPAYVTVAAMVYRGGGPRARRPKTTTKTTTVTTVNATARWFTYWMMYAAVLTVEQPCGWLLLRVPFYCLLRAAFFAWCALPIDANGAAFVYVTVVRRHLTRTPPDRAVRPDEPARVRLSHIRHS